MQPADLFENINPENRRSYQISIALVCILSPSKTSGARYQRVTTFGVIGCWELEGRARPKSAEINE